MNGIGERGIVKCVEVLKVYQSQGMSLLGANVCIYLLNWVEEWFMC